MTEDDKALVERLRHENECLHATIAQVEYPCSPHCHGYLNELRFRDRIEAQVAEIERLRCELEIIALVNPKVTNVPVLQAIASAALGDTQ